MDPIPLEDLALLEVLQRIDQCLPLQSGDTKIHQRLVDSGLVTVDSDPMQLTSAGIELCKSLQHRVAADKQAAQIIERREAGEDAVARDARDGNGRDDGLKASHTP